MEAALTPSPPTSSSPPAPATTLTAAGGATEEPLSEAAAASAGSTRAGAEFPQPVIERAQNTVCGSSTEVGSAAAGAPRPTMSHGSERAQNTVCGNSTEAGSAAAGAPRLKMSYGSAEAGAAAAGASRSKMSYGIAGAAAAAECFSGEPEALQPTDSCSADSLAEGGEATAAQATVTVQPRGAIAAGGDGVAATGQQVALLRAESPQPSSGSAKVEATAEWDSAVGVDVSGLSEGPPVVKGVPALRTHMVAGSSSTACAAVSGCG